MITLHGMNEEEFRGFRESSVSDYAEDLMKGRGLGREQALREAEKEFDEILPDGLETEHGFLMHIEDANGNRVGWICFRYYRREDDGRYDVFLEDLLIFGSERRKGFASAAIDAMNAMAKRFGCASSVLYVWDHTPEGMRLYEKCGYRPKRREGEGTIMGKEL